MRALICVTLISGWANIWHSISTPVEITAAVILLSFWDPNVSQHLLALHMLIGKKSYRQVTRT